MTHSSGKIEKYFFRFMYNCTLSKCVENCIYFKLVNIFKFVSLHTFICCQKFCTLLLLLGKVGKLSNENKLQLQVKCIRCTLAHIIIYYGSRMIGAYCNVATFRISE